MIILEYDFVNNRTPSGGEALITGGNLQADTLLMQVLPTEQLIFRTKDFWIFS
jgi:hypothetical protein